MPWALFINGSFRCIKTELEEQEISFHSSKVENFQITKVDTVSLND